LHKNQAKLLFSGLASTSSLRETLIKLEVAKAAPVKSKGCALFRHETSNKSVLP